MSLTEELHRLVDDLLPFAEKMLREHKEFLPFGGHMKPDGEVVWEGAYNGEELPLSQDLIDMLHESNRSMPRQHLRKAWVHGKAKPHQGFGGSLLHGFYPDNAYTSE